MAQELGGQWLHDTHAGVLTLLKDLGFELYEPGQQAGWEKFPCASAVNDLRRKITNKEAGQASLLLTISPIIVIYICIYECMMADSLLGLLRP